MPKALTDEYNMIRILYILLCLVILSNTLLADDKSDAREIVKRKLDSVFAVLQKEDLDQQAKKQEIDAIVSPMFDFGLLQNFGTASPP